MYLLVEGSKGSYDRPIELSILGIYNTLKEASNKLIQLTYEEPEILEEAIEKKSKYIGEEIWEASCHLDYTDDLLSYYSTGCPVDNEYDGTTIQIFKVGE